jgi:hypothetical protein
MNKHYLRWLKLILIIGLSTLLWGCLSKINQTNYEKIQTGMTMEEVKKILGEPTESKTAGGGDLLSGTSAIWQDDGTTIDIKFINGKVKFKTFNEAKK